MLAANIRMLWDDAKNSAVRRIKVLFEEQHADAECCHLFQEDVNCLCVFFLLYLVLYPCFWREKVKRLFNVLFLLFFCVFYSLIVSCTDQPG